MLKRKVKRIGNVVIILLGTIIIIMSLKAYKGYSDTQKAKAVVQQQIVLQEKTKAEIETWSQKVNDLKASVSKVSKLVVLEGTGDVNITFDNKEFDNSGGYWTWVKNKFDEMASKSMTISSQYRFGYSYDLNSIEIKDLGTNNLEINLYQNRLMVEYIEENTDKRILNSEVGLFAKTFTPQQTSALMDRVQKYTRNNVISNKEIREKAINSAKSDLIELINKCGIKDVKINIIDDKLINNDYASVNNVTYKVDFK